MKVMLYTACAFTMCGYALTAGPVYVAAGRFGMTNDGDGAGERGRGVYGPRLGNFDSDQDEYLYESPVTAVRKRADEKKPHKTYFVQAVESETEDTAADRTFPSLKMFEPYPENAGNPVPVHVPVQHRYAVVKEVPVPHRVFVDRPYPVHIQKPYPVYVQKEVPYPVVRKVPVPVNVPVDNPYPVHVPVEKIVPYPVEQEVHYPITVHVDRSYPVAVLKNVSYPVVKPVPYPVEKPVRIPVPVPVKVPVPYPDPIDDYQYELYELPGQSEQTEQPEHFEESENEGSQQSIDDY